MRGQAILINVILDRSGSMGPQQADVIGGFNRFLQDQRQAPGRARMILTQFNTEVTPPTPAVPIAEVLPLTPATYTPGGNTALFDAIAQTVGRADGEENSSRETALEQHRTLGVRSVGAKLQVAAADHLPLIHQALHQHRRLRLRYYSMHRDEETDRAVDPYHLTYHAGGLYLVAHCHLRKDVRIFAVERIRAARLLADRYTIPADFDPVAYLNAAWGMVRGDRLRIRVAFAAELAPHIKERLWHATQRFRTLPDRRLEMSLEVADTLEVRRWILGYGAQAEVLEPASLREALRREAAAVVDALTPVRRPLASAAGGAKTSRARVQGAG